MSIGYLLVFLLSGTIKTMAKDNILFIVVDDLRPALGCYNDTNALSPNIDKLANRSVLFQNAFAQQALCAPSRNSFLTSRRPDTIHLYNFHGYWRSVAGNFTTLPQYFKENGYHTVSIGKVFHPGSTSNGTDDQPYSWSEKPYHPTTQRYKEAPVCPNRNKTTFNRNIVCPVIVKYQPGKSLPDIQTIKKAKQFFRKPLEKPFFLAIGLHKPHIPLKFPEKYLDLHPLDQVQLASNRWHPYGLPVVAWNPWNDLRERDDIKALNLTFPFEPIPDDYSRLIRQSYYAAITYIDDLVGQLLSELEKSGKSKNTVIVFIGDHGWSMGEHGEWSKYSNFNIAVRVPFLLHVPNKTEGGFISKELVELVDIFPTLVEIARLPPLPTCPDKSSTVHLCTEGVSLEPLLQHSYHQWKSGAFSQYPRESQFPTQAHDCEKPSLKHIKMMGYSLRTHQYRFTEWVQFDTKQFLPIWSDVIATELYDLYLDPEENFNMAYYTQMAAVMRRLRKQLHAGWRYSLPVM